MLKTAAPPTGFLTKILARFFAARLARVNFASMGEREFQDIGWGQTDRYSNAESLDKQRHSL